MFGMIEGAIIGGAVGLVLLKRKGLRDRFLRLLREQGPDAARALLDDKHPALTQIPSDARMSLDSFTSDKGLVPLLIWQALAVALDSTGQQQQAAGLRARVQALTNAFDS